MTQGRWLDAPQEPNTKRSFRNWQAPGCLIHEYKAKDISSCLESQRIVYIGDSTVRQVFWATARKLDLKGAETEMRVAEKHADLSFVRDNVFVDFIWDPFLNSSRLQDELGAYRPRPPLTTRVLNSSQSAAILLVGGGLWDARHIGVAPLKHFRDSIDKIVSTMMSAKPGKTPNYASLTHASEGGAKNVLFLAPVQVPMYESLSPPRAATITPEKIDPMNDYLQQLSEHQGADVLWSYSLMTWRVDYAYEESGIHVVHPVANRKADVLLNLRCNAEAAVSTGYPFDRTCCSAYGRVGWVQWLFLVNVFAVLPIVTLITMRGTWRAFASEADSDKIYRFQTPADATIRQTISCTPRSGLGISLLLPCRPYPAVQQTPKAIRLVRVYNSLRHYIFAWYIVHTWSHADIKSHGRCEQEPKTIRPGVSIKGSKR